MALEGKTLFCFCHWGGKNEVRADGSATYIGGVTDQVIVNWGTTYDAFAKTVFDRLGLEPLGKMLHFSVKFDKSQLIRLNDQSGVDTLIKFNDDFAHVYVLNCELEAAEAPAPVIDTTRGSTTEVEPQQNQRSAERHVSRDQSASLPVTDSSLGGNANCEEEPISVTNGNKDTTPVFHTEWGELLVGEGQAFDNADAFRQAVYKYAFAKRFTYKFLESKPNYLRVVCTIDGCPWKITVGNRKKKKKKATGGNEGYQVSITRFMDTHSHSPIDQKDFKPKYMCRFMGTLFPKENLDGPNILPRDVCADALTNFDIPLTYRQAWRIKQKAIEAVEGKVEDSYRLIPWVCNRLVEAMPGTVATWSCTEDNRFKQLFVSYECSILGFHAGCRPLIFIDVYHSKGISKSTFLAASALDANNEMYPLAYGVVIMETEENWLWFFEHLKLVVRAREVVIVSDRNPSILPAVDKIFGEDNHAHCFHCVQENFRMFIDTNQDFKGRGRGKEIAEKYLIDIADARTMDLYNEALAKMCNFRREFYNWVIANRSEHWSNARFRKVRWDCISCNFAELFELLLGQMKLSQIPEIMEAYRENLSILLQRRKSEIGNWKLPVGCHIEHKVLENQKLGQNLVASILSDFEIKINGSHGREEFVNLKLGTCTCLEWQMTGIPCPHVCCSYSLLNMDVYQCVVGWYKREVQERIYAEVMSDVPKFDIPHPSEVNIGSAQIVENGSTSEINVVLSPLPSQIKRSRGRPRKILSVRRERYKSSR